MCVVSYLSLHRGYPFIPRGMRRILNPFASSMSVQWCVQWVFMCVSFCVDRFACFRFKTRFWFIAYRTPRASLTWTPRASLTWTPRASLIRTHRASLIRTHRGTNCPPFNNLGGFLCYHQGHKGRSSATSKQAASETFFIYLNKKLAHKYLLLLFVVHRSE